MVKWDRNSMGHRSFLRISFGTVGLFLQVWRHVTGTQYKLIHQFTSTVTTTGIHHITLSMGQRSYVDIGDVIGLYTGTSTPSIVPVDDAPCSKSHPQVFYSPTNLPLPDILGFYESGSVMCRNYSIEAKYWKGTVNYENTPLTHNKHPNTNIKMPLHI